MNGYKQNKRPLQSIIYLLSLLLLFTLALAQPVFASTGPPLVGAKEASVVRLLVSYTHSYATGAVNSAGCTGLGVLVKSLPASSDATIPNDWVLTNGSLVNKTPVCATSQSTDTLSQVQIYFNTASPSKSKVVTIDTKVTSGVSSPITCSNSSNCSNGPALIAFHGDQLPVVDLATSSLANNSFAIGLTTEEGAGTFPTASDNPTNFLTPVLFSGNTPNLEAGTPFIDNTGHLTNLYFADAPLPVPSSVISSLIGLANKQTAPSTTTPGPQQSGGGIVIAGISLELWQLSILILALPVLIVIMSLFMRSRLRHAQQLEAELDEADRRIVAQEFKQMAVAQRAWAQHYPASEQSTVPVLPQGLQDKTLVRQTVGDLRCPRCGEFVPQEANYCVHCSQLLTPSETGLHLRIQPPASLAQPSTDATLRVEFDVADIRADINVKQLMEQEGG